MSIKEIKEIFKFLKDTDIVEFEHERPNFKVRFRRSSVQPVETDVIQSGNKSLVPTDQDAGEGQKNLETIVSPMVGTFYSTPSPEAQPFIEVGSMIKKGQVLCIIEAMKLMNELESEYNGKVVSILADNGQPVEYGEPLILIEP